MKAQGYGILNDNFVVVQHEDVNALVTSMAGRFYSTVPKTVEVKVTFSQIVEGEEVLITSDERIRELIKTLAPDSKIIWIRGHTIAIELPALGVVFNNGYTVSFGGCTIYAFQDALYTDPGSDTEAKTRFENIGTTRLADRVDQIEAQSNEIVKVYNRRQKISIMKNIGFLGLILNTFGNEWLFSINPLLNLILAVSSTLMLLPAAVYLIFEWIELVRVSNAAHSLAEELDQLFLDADRYGWGEIDYDRLNHRLVKALLHLDSSLCKVLYQKEVLSLLGDEMVKGKRLIVTRLASAGLDYQFSVNSDIPSINQ